MEPTSDSTTEPAPARWPDLAGWIAIAGMLVLLGLVKINPGDVPWHLATARLHEQLGHWPTQNTFSWTFPEYTLYQQYPVFQWGIYAVYRLGGWAALSLATCLGWTAVFALFVRAAGPWRSAAPFHPFWALVAFSVQTRTALRPDLVSLSLLASSLIVLDGYRRRRYAIAFLPLLHVLWVNGHQLFVLSFAIQVLFIGHLVLTRLGLGGADPADARLPLWPPLLALAASLGLSLISPLGQDIVHVFAHTAGSLASHRADVQELARVWSDPVWLAIALSITAPTAALLVRSWRTTSPFELGLWLIGLAIGASAIRGLVYATLISGTVFQRTLLRQPITWRPSLVLRRYFRALGVTGSGLLMLAVLYHRWLVPSTQLDGVQPGVGRTEGDWPDAAIATLQGDPPPGAMMNLPWSSANALIWEWPTEPVFVDPRFESYPRAFLVDALRSRHDDAVLGRLLARYRPTWIFVEHCGAPERARVAHLVHGGGWQVTYADAAALALVTRTSRTALYRERHPFLPAREPRALVTAPPARRARQRLCYARLIAALGFTEDARTQLTDAALEAHGDPALISEIRRADHELGTSAP